MRFNKILFLSIFFFIIIAGYLLKDFYKTKNPLENVNSYRIYYRGINEEILKDMRNYDLLVVEANHFDKQAVEVVKNNNYTMIFGYLSIMEIGNWDKEIIDRLEPADYLKINGDKAYNEKYNNYIGDISREHYQEVLLDVLEKRILSKGLDGVFIDTTAWIDNHEDDKEVYKKTLEGYEKFLIKVKEKYPDILILQNRGFEVFFTTSNNYTDGFVWENFNAPTVNKRKSIQDRIDKLERIRTQKNVVIFSISYENEAENKTFAQKMKWKHLQQNNSSHHNEWTFGN